MVLYPKLGQGHRHQPNWSVGIKRKNSTAVAIVQPTEGSTETVLGQILQNFKEIVLKCHILHRNITITPLRTNLDR